MTPPASAPEQAPDNRATAATEARPGVQVEGAGAGLCARRGCPEAETRISGYCSTYCRDVAEAEHDRDAWCARAEARLRELDGMAEAFEKERVALSVWRAHTEALAGALHTILRMEGPAPGCPPDEGCHLCDEARAALARLPADALAERSASCPCAYGEPCHPDCTCACPVSSKGCLRCCRYGNRDQRQAAAARLVAERRAWETACDLARGCLRAAQANNMIVEGPDWWGTVRKALAALDAARTMPPDG